MAKISARPDSEVPFITARAFSAPGIVHGFFGRRGGVSGGVYESLNCGLGSKDDAAHVIENRARVAAAVGAGPGNLLSLYQIHSAVCLKVTQAWDAHDRPQADGMVTDVPGIALCAMAADCVPVLFHGCGGHGQNVIGAAHAGWKGAIGGILESTVGMMMKEYGVAVESIRAAIGPCIQKKSYEVGDEFFRTFIEEDVENERFFQGSRKAGHYMFDLSGYSAARLRGAGVPNIHLEDADTYGNERDYFSFRRATHRGEADYGRQVSAIMIADSGR